MVSDDDVVVVDTMPQDPELRRDMFLAELTKLTEKYGIQVYGCGCCYAVHDQQSNESWQHLNLTDKGYVTSPW